MAERQQPYVPAKTLQTDYPVSVPRIVIELILNFIGSLSTATRTYVYHRVSHGL